jgi:lia operon protein LiaG
MKKLIIFLIIIICFYMIGTNLQKVSWLPFGHKGTQSSTIENINMIDINVSGADTIIIPDDRENLKAELKGKGKLNVTKSGDSVKVELKHNWFEGFSFWSRKRLTIYLPEEYDHKMSIKLGSGNVHFSGQSKDQPMKVDELAINMSSGNVDLENLDIQHFKHIGSSGNAQLDSVSTKEGSFTMSSGNIELSHYQGALKARLSSGRLKAQLDELKNPIDVKISSGIVKLDLPKNSNFTLKGEVSSGNISCDFPLNSRQISGQKIDGSFGTGENKIKLEASSGSINIY